MRTFDEIKGLIETGLGRHPCDLKLANVLWLQSAGLKHDQISVCAACTACDRTEFWSHRLVGKVRGSMAAMICLPGRPL